GAASAEQAPISRSRTRSEIRTSSGSEQHVAAQPAHSDGRYLTQVSSRSTSAAAMRLFTSHRGVGIDAASSGTRSSYGRCETSVRWSSRLHGGAGLPNLAECGLAL